MRMRVNTSQKVEIIEGKTYTLIFDAWSNVEKNNISGYRTKC